MIVCTTSGAAHAEKAIVKWLRKHESDTIFVACTSNNEEALQLYKDGAHFVMQTEALAVRSAKTFFLDSVANVGDCSHLVIAGKAHSQRLTNLKKDEGLRFRYE